MGKLSPVKPLQPLTWGTVAVLGSLAVLSMPHSSLAQNRPSAQEFARANRVAEALRQVTLQGNTRNPGYYGDWQVKGDRIPLWSRQCIGRSLTPQQFEADQGAATSVVTCIIQDMLRQEIRSAGNNESVAIRRVASWWVTGDPGRFDDSGIAPYTQQVLSTYRPNGPLTAAQPAPPKPISIAGISNVQPTAQPVQPTQPVLAAPVQPQPVRPQIVSVPTETLPAIKPRPVAQAQPAQPTTQPSTQPLPTKPVVAKSAAERNTPQLIQPNGTNFYDRYMQTGYAASRERDFTKALLFFRRALDERPNDSYATTAITNMEAALSTKAN